MEESIGSLGFFIMGGVVVAALLIYRIVDFMLNKYGGSIKHLSGGSACPCIQDKEKFDKLVDKLDSINWKEFERKNDIMFALHDVKDSEGVPIWYVRNSLEEAIKQLTRAVENQTQLISAMINEVRTYHMENKAATAADMK